MKLKIPYGRRPPGSITTRYVTACQFPKNPMAVTWGKQGAVAKKQFYSALIRRYQDEVSRYMAEHPGATIFDVSLVCHMSDEMARRLMKEARR